MAHTSGEGVQGCMSCCLQDMVHQQAGVGLLRQQGVWLLWPSPSLCNAQQQHVHLGMHQKACKKSNERGQWMRQQCC
jgi:hypothetical protein